MKKSELDTVFENLNKVTTIYGFTAAAIACVIDDQTQYLSLFKSASNSPWRVVMLEASEIAGFEDKNISVATFNAMAAQYANWKIIQLPFTAGQKSLDSQLSKLTGCGWSSKWKFDNGALINESIQTVAIYHHADLLTKSFTPLLVDDAMFQIEGLVNAEREFNNVSIIRWGCTPHELLTAKADITDSVAILADKIRDWHKTKHNRITEIETIEQWDDLSSNIKTVAAKKVLSLMDSVIDGDCRYFEFVQMVSRSEGITVQQLNKELILFI
ncbi:hypothetical protein [Photobacterium leiognathi]|uniref:hypothetical protein n=1 Tax=Photobacterium leiognathi TaxID=553611 RepID=UPI002981DB34|nr:hypothetical protein [Photobacterium leiognathi]